MKQPWMVKNDTPVWMKPRRTVYFLARGNDGEQYEDCRGRVRNWRTLEQAQVACDRLNWIEQPVTFGA